MKNRLELAALILVAMSLSSFYAFHGFSMWQEGLTYSEDGSTSIGVYVQASTFLSQGLGQNETALVPMSGVFCDLNPALRSRLVDYRSIWNLAGVVLQANTTKEEILRVRSYLAQFVKQNPQIKFLIRDWVDPYCTDLYQYNVADDGLMVLLKEVKTIPFTLSTGWSNSITIYEVVHSALEFVMPLYSPPEQYFIIPSNASILFDSSGATIQKTGSDRGFYVPLKEGINASSFSYMDLQVKLDVANADLEIVFYYDKNRDGRFSGYSVDYVESVVFNQVEQGWTEGQSFNIAHVIPKAEDPVVQIGLILLAGSNGTATFSNLTVYTEIP